MAKFIFGVYLVLFVPLAYGGVRTGQTVTPPAFVLMFAGAVLPVQRTLLTPRRILLAKPEAENLRSMLANTQEFTTRHQAREKRSRGILGRVLVFRRQV